MTNQSDPALYPLRFREILRDYSFGNRWIVSEFDKTDLPENHHIGETWEVCDRPNESSEIINGPLAGKTLHEAIDRYGEALLGTEMVARFGAVFPLLIKFLDATHMLGEQCHTDDELTRARGIDDYFGKTEAWYMLRVRPGAKTFCGNRPGVDREKLIEAMLCGDSRLCMAEYDTSPGDAFLLYAGTMHYSPGGLLFYEIMQNSNVYVGLGRGPDDISDAERLTRAEFAAEAVHLEDGFDAKTPPVTVKEGENGRTFIFACDKFALERLDLVEPYTLRADGRKFFILTAIEGAATVTQADVSVKLLPGNTCLLPAGADDATIRPEPSAAVLKAYVPDLVADIVEPLTARGIAAEAIRALGGKTRLNPLARLV